MERNKEKKTGRTVKKAKPENAEHTEKPVNVEQKNVEQEKAPKTETKKVIIPTVARKKIEDNEDLEFAPPNTILVIEIKNDGIAYMKEAKYTGKGYCLVDNVSKRTYMIKTSTDKHPPFFYVPHWIATGKLANIFLNLAKTFGLKRVMYPSLLYLENNLKPVKVKDEDEPYILDWRSAKTDIVTGIEWSQSLGTAKMANIIAQRQNESASNMFLYALLGIVTIGIVLIIYMLMVG